MNKHAHWKVYGYAYTCSNCGHCRVGSTKYCMKCGALMDESEEMDIPKLEYVQLPRRIICPFCNYEMYEIKEQTKFCYNCGMKLDS